MQLILQNLRNYKLLFFLLPILYFILYGFYGFDDTDRAFVAGLSYRLLNGEMPYMDFMYVRPPVTPVLHAIEMAILPDSIEMIAMRFNFYLFEWLSVLLSLLALKRFFDFEKMGIPIYLFGSISFIFMVHNYPAMPWHTVDGILFGALGFYLITLSDKYYVLIAGLVATGLSALCKQSFGLVPFAGMGLAFVLYGFKKTAISSAVSIAGGILVLLLFEMSSQIELIKSIVSQTTGSTSLDDARWGAYQLYVRPAVATFTPMALLYWALKKWDVKNRAAIFAGFTYLALVAVFMVPTIIGLIYQEFMPPRHYTYHALLFGGWAISAIYFWRDKSLRKGMALVFAMCVLSWSTGISWGYAIPVLYALPGLFGVIWFVGSIAKFKAPRLFWPSLALLAFVSFYVNSQYPYRDAHRSELKYDLGEVFPKLSYIYTGKKLYDKHVDFKELHEKYGDKFTVLPAFPHAHYVLDINSPVQIDWAHDAELQYEFGVNWFRSRINSIRPIVFVEKDKEHEAVSPVARYRCSILKYVLDNWTMIDESPFFKVFVHPEEG